MGLTHRRGLWGTKARAMLTSMWLWSQRRSSPHWPSQILTRTSSENRNLLGAGRGLKAKSLLSIYQACRPRSQRLQQPHQSTGDSQSIRLFKLQVLLDVCSRGGSGADSSSQHYGSLYNTGSDHCCAQDPQKKRMRCPFQKVEFQVKINAVPSVQSWEPRFWQDESPAPFCGRGEGLDPLQLRSLHRSGRLWPWPHGWGCPVSADAIASRLGQSLVVADACNSSWTERFIFLDPSIVAFLPFSCQNDLLQPCFNSW